METPDQIRARIEERFVRVARSPAGEAMVEATLAALAALDESAA